LNPFGKRAIVVGGCAVVAEGVVRELIDRGAQVALLDLDEDRGVDIARDTGASFFRVDLADPDSIESMLADVIEDLGEISILVNCAAYTIWEDLTHNGQPHDLQRFRRTIDVNLTGLLHCCAVMAAHMGKLQPDASGERGVIVNTSSGMGYEATPALIAYAISKAGILGLTKPMADALTGQQIRVCSVAPGPMESHAIRKLPRFVQGRIGKALVFPQRIGQASEFADTVLQLIENSGLNGITVRFDAATRAKPKALPRFLRSKN